MSLNSRLVILKRRSPNHSSAKVFETSQATPSELLAMKPLGHPRRYPPAFGNLLITDRNTQRSIIYSLGQVQVSPLPPSRDIRIAASRLERASERASRDGRQLRSGAGYVGMKRSSKTAPRDGALRSNSRPSPRGSLGAAGEGSFVP